MNQNLSLQKIQASRRDSAGPQTTRAVGPETIIISRETLLVSRRTLKPARHQCGYPGKPAGINQLPSNQQPPSQNTTLRNEPGAANHPPTEALR